MQCKQVDNKIKAFTIVELLVSITISVILLWGIFYFMSDTILGISRSSTQSKFLKDFYSFTTIFDTWKLEILHDYTWESFDVGILKSLNGENGILIWVVDFDTLRLSSTWSVNRYHNSVLGYRALSSLELGNIETDANVVYDLTFFWDKLFNRFNLQYFDMTSYNSWSTVEMWLSIFPNYNPTFYNQAWNELPKDQIFKYSLVF